MTRREGVVAEPDASAEMPEQEFEITSAMVEAGAKIISDCRADLFEGWLSPDDVARDVWASMAALAPTGFRALL
jgi:hypothetical protein